MESDDLTNSLVRLVSGTALLESDVVDVRLNTRVLVGPRKIRIGSSGLYRFTSETASVIDGSLQLELETGGLEYRIAKGQQVTRTSGVQCHGEMWHRCFFFLLWMNAVGSTRNTRNEYTTF
jgi:hypothetical protein